MQRVSSACERRRACRIVLGLIPVRFIGGQAGEGEQRQRDVVGAFGGQEVAVVAAAEFLDQRDPEFPVMFEFGQLGRVDDVAEIAGDHGMRRALCGWRNAQPMQARGARQPRAASLATLSSGVGFARRAGQPVLQRRQGRRRAGGTVLGSIRPYSEPSGVKPAARPTGRCAGRPAPGCADRAPRPGRRRLRRSEMVVQVARGARRGAAGLPAQPVVPGRRSGARGQRHVVAGLEAGQQCRRHDRPMLSRISGVTRQSGFTGKSSRRSASDAVARNPAARRRPIDAARSPGGGPGRRTAGDQPAHGHRAFTGQHHRTLGVAVAQRINGVVDEGQRPAHGRGQGLAFGRQAQAAAGSNSSRPRSSLSLATRRLTAPWVSASASAAARTPGRRPRRRAYRSGRASGCFHR